jgi:hypothetical protein
MPLAMAIRIDARASLVVSGVVFVKGIFLCLFAGMNKKGILKVHDCNARAVT